MPGKGTVTNLFEWLRSPVSTGDQTPISHMRGECSNTELPWLSTQSVWYTCTTFSQKEMSIIVHNMWSNAWSISELSKTKNARYLLKAILQEVMPKSLYIVLGFSFQGAKIADNISIEMSKLICLKNILLWLILTEVAIRERDGFCTITWS